MERKSPEKENMKKKSQCLHRKSAVYFHCILMCLLYVCSRLSSYLFHLFKLEKIRILFWVKMYFHIKLPLLFFIIFVNCFIFILIVFLAVTFIFPTFIFCLLVVLHLYKNQLKNAKNLLF